MANERILIVEDDEDILELVRYNLEKNGFRPISASSGEIGLKKAAADLPDLIILDIMLPGVDGLTVCRQIKADEKTKNIPVMMLTAKGEETDVVTGLELGADDYVTKPFSPKVLLARVRAMLRRGKSGDEEPAKVIRRGPIEIDPARHQVTVKGKAVDLTFSEFRILQLLAGRPGMVFERYRIVDQVHGEDYPVTDRSVDVQITGLRKKLGTAGDLIETVRGVGYRFVDSAK